jgi:microcystin-dependent protein
MSEPYLGEIKAFAFGIVPQGYAPCNGQQLYISMNTALFSILGVYYGGDGRQFFNLPDLRGAVPIGMGQGPGLTNRQNPGMSGGSEMVTLQPANLPSHTHTVQGSSQRGNKTTPAGNVWAADASGRTMDYQSAAPNDTMQANLLGAQGGGQPHNNRQPFMAVSFMIAMQGIFPSRI